MSSVIKDFIEHGHDYARLAGIYSGRLEKAKGNNQVADLPKGHDYFKILQLLMELYSLWKNNELPSAPIIETKNIPDLTIGSEIDLGKSIFTKSEKDNGTDRNPESKIN